MFLVSIRFEFHRTILFSQGYGGDVCSGEDCSGAKSWEQGAPTALGPQGCLRFEPAVGPDDLGCFTA